MKRVWNGQSQKRNTHRVVQRKLFQTVYRPSRITSWSKLIQFLIQYCVLFKYFTRNKREDEVPSHSSTKVQEKSNNNKEDDGLYDFVDSPYGSQIVGSASSQASRVNIKKAPNGQEYEYEYVYYYYDEDEEHAKPGSKSNFYTLAFAIRYTFKGWNLLFLNNRWSKYIKPITDTTAN